MRPFIALLLMVLPCIIYAQPAAPYLKDTSHPKRANSPTLNVTRGINEICNNNIDDDGDGLTDMDDYHCYFNNTSNSTTCTPSRILWSIATGGIWWRNLDNNTSHFVGNPSDQEYWGDITWTANGKLYLSEMVRGEIWEANPVDGSATFVASIPGYYSLNALTADAQSNLYIAARPTSGWYTSSILKFNPSTGQITPVIDLSSYWLYSAGDMVFMNNYLYVACLDMKIAKIDITTGTVETIVYTGEGTTQSYGLTSFGDGYLYMCIWNKLYRVDLSTRISSYYATVSPDEFFSMGGMASYSDPCQSPGCKPKLSIQINSPTPYCSNTGVALKASGSGISGVNRYIWTLPDDTHRIGDTLTAFAPGIYSVRYHSIPDTCGTTASVNISIMEPPRIVLPRDTVLCQNATMLLTPVVQGASQFTWQNGSNAASLQVNQPGLYWVETNNACAVVRDSILIHAGTAPTVFIGNDTLLCPDSARVLQNTLPKQPWDTYLWSTSQTSNSISVSNPGWYWLIATNTCAVTTDSIYLAPKDSCLCNPVYAAAGLGEDQALCPGNTQVIKNSSDLPQYRYLWQDGSNNPYFNVSGAGVYWLEVSTYCNTVRDSIIVTKKDNCTCETFLPSVFTPNNDGLNDLFKPLCYCDISGSLSIYNRYGQLVFYSEDLRKGWDGRYKNMPQSTGSYIFTLKYKVTGRPAVIHKKGSFVLLR